MAASVSVPPGKGWLLISVKLETVLIDSRRTRWRRETGASISSHRLGIASNFEDGDDRRR